MDNDSSMNADEILAGPVAASVFDPETVDVSIDRLEPAGDRLIVEPLVVDQSVTKGGIVIPEQAKQKPVFGVVTHVGPGPWNEHIANTPAPASVGDIVLYGKYAGIEVETLGQKLLVLRGSDVVAVQRR